MKREIKPSHCSQGSLGLRVQVCPESVWVGTRTRDALNAAITGLSRVSRSVPSVFDHVRRSCNLRSRDAVCILILGTPGRTDLSTNWTCQLEKTENSRPKCRSAGYRHRPASRYGSLSAESRKLQHMPNVGDKNRFSWHSDAVNKMGPRVRS